MKKILFSFTLIALIFTAVMSAPVAEGRVKAYYSGSVASYGDYIVIGTTNLGQLELFKSRAGATPVKFAGLKSYDARYALNRDFYDVLVRQESDRLYAYAVDGRALFKYDITDLKTAQRINRVEDGSWDWFAGLTVIGDQVATIGSRGIKLWNNGLVVTDSYPITNTGNNRYNITPADSDKFIFNIADGKITIYDREGRREVSSVPLTFKWGSDWFKRSIYNDKIDNAVYVIDDEAVRKINFEGEIEKSFRHTGTLGYDVVPSSDGTHVYFSDGIGVVKLRKDDLRVTAFRYTTNFGLSGGWAMGLRTVRTNQGERVVVFNNSSIIILDSNLNPIKSSGGRLASISSTIEETFPDVTEPLALAIDKNHGLVGSHVILHGQGFGKNESLMINFAGLQIPFEADQFGRFSKELIVPSHTPAALDIIVSGLDTLYHYNLGFTID